MGKKGKHNSDLTPNARKLRKNMKKQEKHLWYDFLNSYPVKILRQKVIGFFVADFYCARAKLIIEIDGSQHFTKTGKEYDMEREKIIENYGIKIIRYTNNAVENDFDFVCNDIEKHIKNRME